MEVAGLTIPCQVDLIHRDVGHVAPYMLRTVRGDLYRLLQWWQASQVSHPRDEPSVTQAILARWIHWFSDSDSPSAERQAAAANGFIGIPADAWEPADDLLVTWILRIPVAATVASEAEEDDALLSTSEHEDLAYSYSG